MQLSSILFVEILKRFKLSNWDEKLSETWHPKLAIDLANRRWINKLERPESATYGDDIDSNDYIDILNFDVSNSISEYARLSSNYPGLQIRWIWNFRFFPDFRVFFFLKNGFFSENSTFRCSTKIWSK
jgi:hypothetical protein